jgi:hypothetical protein
MAVANTQVSTVVDAPSPRRAQTAQVRPRGTSAATVRWTDWLPSQGALVCLSAAVGLVVCCYAQDRSRETLAPNPWIFWGGVLLIVVPIAYRATALHISSLERFLLVGVEGLAIFLARLMRDAYGYSFTDDFPHALNLQHIVATHHLYHANVLLPITAHYPGLEAAASALAFLTGMSSWGTGMLFVGVARVTLMLALYVLFTGISRSARVGALGALLFSANSNFFFFETQFAYESLSLPLLAVALAALAERQRAGKPADLFAWGVVAVATICAIIPTHHLTSYLLVGVLWTMCLRRVWLPRPFRSVNFEPGPPVWPFAMLTSLLALAWLTVVASQTVGYVSPDIISAFEQAFRTVTGGTKARGLFSNTAGSIAAGSKNLLTEEAASFLEPVLLLISGGLGAHALWRVRRIEPIVWVLTVLAILYFFLTALRVVPSAWEVGNRGSEFAFIGMAFMVGAATLRKPKLWSRPWVRLAVGLACGICVIGGAVAGMEANARLAHPTLFTAGDGHKIYSESEAIGRFFTTLPPGQVIADDADAMAINLYGNHVAYTGFEVSADQILSTPQPYSWEPRVVRGAHIRYVVVDFRQRSQNTLTGEYLNMVPPAAPVDVDYKPGIATVWKSQGAAIYDSGDVIVYDLDRRP